MSMTRRGRTGKVLGILKKSILRLFTLFYAEQFEGNVVFVFSAISDEFIKGARRGMRKRKWH